jgi:hypothetical protein
MYLTFNESDKIVVAEVSGNGAFDLCVQRVRESVVDHPELPVNRRG